MNDYEKLSKKYFNKQAFEYDENCSVYYSAYGKISCEDVATYLKNVPYEKLLDVGSGTGFLINQLSLQHKAEYFGLDIAENMIEVSEKKNIENAKFILGQADSLPFEDSSFDIVTCIQSFHHYPYPEKAMQEVYRVLRPNGYYILSDTGVGGIAAWFDNNILFPLIKSGDYKTGNKDYIGKMMKKTGFKIKRKDQLKRFIYTVVGVK